MLTPQEVSTHAFTKAVMGGYNMSMVDEFLDELTDDYTALYKENAALKAKMKVLVEKIEEYRATEDSMRATLLTAQRMADSIVREAEAKRDAILSQAETDAQVKILRYQEDLVVAQRRLEEGQAELNRFVATTRELCRQELAFLEKLPQLEVTAPVPAMEEIPAREIEESVKAAFAVESEEIAAEEPVEEPAAEEAAPVVDDYPVGNPFAPEEPLDATRRINLEDLKFGRNYSGE
jgi:cell division initiation protein